MGEIKKNIYIFLLKVSNIQLNYAFLLFWSIFGEIHRKLLFLSKNYYLRKVYRNTQKLFSLHKFEMGQNMSKILICLYKRFWSNQ